MITRRVLDGPAFDLIDLAPTVLHEIVIVLHDVLELLHVLVVLPTTCIRRSKSSMLATSISATSVQYRSAQKSVITRIFGMPTFALSLAIAKNFSTIGRTLPGLQYMISRMSSMWLSRVRVGLFSSSRPLLLP